MLLRRLQRLKGSGTSILGGAIIPNLKRKASNSFSAVQDTYLSTKDVFERHRVVFTISTSLASLLTAWTGYSLRYYHQSKVEKRLESIEHAMKSSYDLEHQEIKRIVSAGNFSTAAYLATAGTTLLVGYGLGWRGGSWYAHRKFRREQLKLLGQVKPNKWQFIRKPLIRSRIFGAAQKHKEVSSSAAGLPDHVPSKADAAGLASPQVCQS